MTSTVFFLLNKYFIYIRYIGIVQSWVQFKFSTLKKHVMVMQLNGTFTFLSTYELKLVNQNLTESITVPVVMLVIELNYHFKTQKVNQCD